MLQDVTRRYRSCCKIYQDTTCILTYSCIYNYIYIYIYSTQLSTKSFPFHPCRKQALQQVLERSMIFQFNDWWLDFERNSGRHEQAALEKVGFYQVAWVYFDVIGLVMCFWTAHTRKHHSRPSHFIHAANEHCNKFWNGNDLPIQ